MSISVDAGVIYAEHDRDAARHDIASRAIESVYEGTFGQPYLSDYLMDETITRTRATAPSFSDVRELIDTLRGREPFPNDYELSFVTQSRYREISEHFERYADHSLSFTDATTITLCRHHGIDHVLSFDDDFDGILPRIDSGGPPIRLRGPEHV